MLRSGGVEIAMNGVTRIRSGGVELSRGMMAMLRGLLKGRSR